MQQVAPTFAQPKNVGNHHRWRMACDQLPPLTESGTQAHGFPRGSSPGRPVRAEEAFPRGRVGSLS